MLNHTSTLAGKELFLFYLYEICHKEIETSRIQIDDPDLYKSSLENQTLQSTLLPVYLQLFVQFDLVKHRLQHI